MKNTLYLHSTDSTNKIAFERAQQGAPHGFGVIAATQTGGRGRLGKKWQSVPGKGLYCSLIIRSKLEISDYPKITMTSGLGVAVALEKLTGLEIGLKWPNDIYSSGKKCCGILSESSPVGQAEDTPFAIVGIGINVNTERDDFPKELHTTATSLFLETDQVFNLDEVFLEVREQVLQLIKEHENDGFAGILSRWKERDILYDKWLEWVANSGEVVYGKSLGPDEAGQLIVCDEGGTCHQVISGDIQLAKTITSR